MNDCCRLVLPWLIGFGKMNLMSSSQTLLTSSTEEKTIFTEYFTLWCTKLIPYLFEKFMLLTLQMKFFLFSFCNISQAFYLLQRELKTLDFHLNCKTVYLMRRLKHSKNNPHRDLKIPRILNFKTSL